MLFFFLFLFVFNFFLLHIFIFILLLVAICHLLFGGWIVNLAGDAVQEGEDVIIKPIFFGYFAVLVLTCCNSQLLFIHPYRLIILVLNSLSLHYLCFFYFNCLLLFRSYLLLMTLFIDDFCFVCIGIGIGGCMVLEVMPDAFFLDFLHFFPQVLPALGLLLLGTPAWVGLPHFNNDDLIILSTHIIIQSRMKITRILSMAASFAGLVAASPLYMSPEPPLYQIIRGEYEDKIRRYSPPQKIFNVFSIANQKGENVLTLYGLLKAICFYNYSEYTDQHLQSFVPKALKQFLGKLDGFQIYDYFAFVRFLAFDRQKLKNFMVQRGISTFDKSSFTDMMLNYVCADYDTYIRENIGIQSRSFRPSKQQFLKSIMCTADSMFQHTGQYSYLDMLQFKKSLMKEMYLYQFKCFKAESAQTLTIDGVEFARSIVKYAQNNQKRKLLRRVNYIEKAIEPIRISEKEYVDFHFELQTNIKRIEQALRARGVVTRPQITAILKNIGDKITDGQVDVFFQLLDTDDSGFIQKRQVLGVIQSLGYYWSVKSGEQTLQQLAEARWKGLQNKVRKIHEIIMEE